MIVFNEASLFRHVKSFVAYYHDSRTHLALAKDTPEPRLVHPPDLGTVVCDTTTRRSSPPVRAARSLNVAVLAAVALRESLANSCGPARQDHSLSPRQYGFLVPLGRNREQSNGTLACRLYVPTDYPAPTGIYDRHSRRNSSP